MTEGKTDEQEVADGGFAEQILTSDIFLNAVAKVRTNTIDNWAREKDPAKREALHAQLGALEGVVEELSIVLAAGHFAQKRIRKAERQRGPGAK